MSFESLTDKKELLSSMLQQKNNSSILYQKHFDHSEYTISFRALQLPQDLDLIFQWVNNPSAKAFWQLDGPIEMLLATYTKILNSPFTHSFIGLLNGSPVCQVDVYHVAHDELKQMIYAKETDYGIHFLMAPVTTTIRNLSVCCMQSFFLFLFSFHNISTLYGEPDVNNLKANKLVVKAGFHLLRTITLSYKTANLYCITRRQLAQTDLFTL